MKLMEFSIPVPPVGQMRARHSVRNGFSVTHKAKEQASREMTLKAFLIRERPEKPLEGPLRLGVCAYMPIPASKPKKWREQARAHVIRPTTKPDLDNMLKHLKDCLTQMGFWKDDKQVVEYAAGTGKYYSESPRWHVWIEEITRQ